MMRVKMPLNFRMQSFIFAGDRILWTSASKTIWQKIKRYLTKDTSVMCNTSEGYTLPCHGQYVRLISNELQPHSPENLKKAQSIRHDKYLQGISGDYAIYGKPDFGDIVIHRISTAECLHALQYSGHKEWWWKYWEAEGIQLHGGKIYAGISVKTKFGFIINYIKRCDNGIN